MRSNSDAAGPAAIRGSGSFGTCGCGRVGRHLLERLDAVAELAQIVDIDHLAHVHEHLTSSSLM